MVGDVMKKEDIDFIAGYIIVASLIVLICSAIAGCDGGWSIGGWEIK